MTAIMVLGALAFGFVALFWLTPIGIPALKRMGGGQMSPDLRFGYGADSTYALLDRYGAPGVRHWQRMLLLDMIFPGVYAAFLALVGAAWTRSTGASAPWRLIAISSPILLAASDYIENILLLAVLRALPRRLPSAVAAASAFTRIKFLLFWVTLAAPLLHWVATRVGSWS